MPTEIDVIEREIMQHEMERQALKKEKDPASKKSDWKSSRRNWPGKGKIECPQASGQKEKADSRRAAKMEEEIDPTSNGAGARTARGDLARASEIQYGRIPELEKKLSDADRKSAKAKEIASSRRSDRGRHCPKSFQVGRDPVSRLQEGEREKLVELETHLHERVVDQERAIKAVANAVRRARAGLQDRIVRSARSFFSTQPASAKRNLPPPWRNSCSTTTSVDPDRHERIHGKHTVARLIGAPPGYIGEEGGQLSEAVRRRPRTRCVLFDESKKAHPDVFKYCCKCSMTVRITDGQGRTGRFQEHRHHHDLKHRLAIHYGGRAIAGGARRPRHGCVTRAFSSRILNRVDEIIIFDRAKRGGSEEDCRNPTPSLNGNGSNNRRSGSNFRFGENTTRSRRVRSRLRCATRSGA